MKRLVPISLTLALLSTAAMAQFSEAPVLVPGTSPVGSPTLVNVGSFSADVLNWVISVTVPIMGVVITGWLTRLFQQVGINMTDAQRARLQEMVVNGINAGAAKAEDSLRGAPLVDVKNAAVQHAVEYVQEHGADTLKALGFDPHDQKTVEAIQARALSAIANPAVPTAPSLNAPIPSLKAV